MIDAERLASAAGASTGRDLSGWEAALVAANAARDAAAGADIDPDLRAQAERRAKEIEHRLAGLRFVAKLDAINTDYRFLDTFDRGPQAEAYRKAFDAELGAPFDETSEQTIAAKLRSTDFREQILLAMDLWARVERELDRHSPRMIQIFRVAERLDDDPWRIRIRRACATDDGDELVQLAKSPESARASATTTYLLAMSLITTNEQAEALALLHRNYDRFPGDYWINHTLALLHVQFTADKDATEALRFATAARALRPDAASPYSLIGECYALRGDQERALQYQEQAAKLAPADPVSNFWVGQSLFRLGRFRDALGKFQDCRDRCPHNHSVYPVCVAWIGNSQLALGDADEAMQSFRQAVMAPFRGREDPVWYLTDPAFHAPALAAARRAVERTGRKDAAALFVLGDLLKVLGHWRESIAVFEELQALDPDFRFVASRIRALRNALGDTLASYGSVDEAVDALPPGLDLAASRARFTVLASDAGQGRDAPRREYLEGRLYERAGRYGEAARHYEATIDADRDAIGAWNRLHRCLVEAHGAEAGDARIRELLQGGTLPPHPVEGGLRSRSPCPAPTRTPRSIHRRSSRWRRWWRSIRAPSSTRSTGRCGTRTAARSIARRCCACRRRTGPSGCRFRAGCWRRITSTRGVRAT